MATWAITGASRGIGLELVRQLTSFPETQVSKVFAITRGTSSLLEEIISSSPTRVVNIIIKDLCSEEDVHRGVDEVRKSTDSLDFLVNNAGTGRYSPDGMHSVTAGELREVLDANLVTAQVVTAAFLPLLKQGKNKKIINISSETASISSAHRFRAIPGHSYKISKAGMNMLTSLYAVEHEDFVVMAISPGWLRTDLAGPDADLPVEVGVASVLDKILEADKSESGKFYTIRVTGWDDNKMGPYDGRRLPW